jgi:four helix bundle protein
MMKRSIIMDMTLNFSLNSIVLYQELVRNKEYIISKQFLRSSTSIGANVFEASAAASRKDFANKMTIASKEARESYYWLLLLKEGKLVNIELDGLVEDVLNIINVLTAIVNSTRTSSTLK